ncbi:hypothetical protein RRG08_046997 [Elysia crispata]|uniref:Uncharacterized protein n=1 Tax=Elysia crispata TaxID=231223 RepID=A0AAE1A8Z9_9GAST|nr:hypothetical protein RRG08_046997 [Elysia crispata]
MWLSGSRSSFCGVAPSSRLVGCEGVSQLSCAASLGLILTASCPAISRKERGEDRRDCFGVYLRLYMISACRLVVKHGSYDQGR